MLPEGFLGSGQGTATQALSMEQELTGEKTEALKAGSLT